MSQQQSKPPTLFPQTEGVELKAPEIKVPDIKEPPRKTNIEIMLSVLGDGFIAKLKAEYESRKQFSQSPPAFNRSVQARFVPAESRRYFVPEEYRGPQRRNERPSPSGRFREDQRYLCPICLDPRCPYSILARRTGHSYE